MRLMRKLVQDAQGVQETGLDAQLIAQNVSLDPASLDHE